MIAAGIAAADKRLAPAKIGWAVGKDDTQVFNRRWKVKPGSALLANPFGGTDQVKMNPGYQHPDLIEPAGPTDPEITLLSVQTPDGKPVALLANYSLHYVGGLPALSADYFGVVGRYPANGSHAGRRRPRHVAHGLSEHEFHGQ